MGKLLKEVLDAVSQLSETEQDRIAVALLELAGGEVDPIEDGENFDAIPPEHYDAVMEGLEQAKRGEFASEEEMNALLDRLRR